VTKTQEIRELAKRVTHVSLSADNYRRRGMWCDHNDMDWEGPAPLHFSLGTRAWNEVLPADCRAAVDPVYRLVETELRKRLWYAGLGDDHVIEPWVDMSAVYFDDAITM